MKMLIPSLWNFVANASRKDMSGNFHDEDGTKMALNNAKLIHLVSGADIMDG